MPFFLFSPNQLVDNHKWQLDFPASISSFAYIDKHVVSVITYISTNLFRIEWTCIHAFNKTFPQIPFHLQITYTHLDSAFFNRLFFSIKTYKSIIISCKILYLLLLSTLKIHCIYIHACQVNFLHTQTIFLASCNFSLLKINDISFFFIVWLSFEDISHMLNSACFTFTTKVTDNNGFDMNYLISWLKITPKLNNLRYIFPFAINA